MKNSNIMKSSELRTRFIDYFKKNQHTLVNSSSLIPENDPTLLFNNAGMNQFKNLFLGLEKRDYVRAVSSQKCVRAGGKHNDLENVGFTARHHTFFEMLGNFSFGDYFKKETIHYAWEFLTKDLGIPKDKLYVTVFQDDDETAEIWHKQEGIPKDRIFRFGEKDNFWRMGETGPCGPCTEIFYDHGEKAGPETDAYKGILSGGDRYIEIWNLVLMQFFEKSPGQMEALPKPSVDTGAGLERLTAVMQGQINNYDTDAFTSLIDAGLNLIPQESSLAELIHHQYKGPFDQDLIEKRAALRVLADHTRSVSFLLADGVIPSNEGRGYVLRRILRRALRYQRKLSPMASFFPAMVKALTETMGPFYGNLLERRDYILNVISDEEGRFTQTLDQGTELLNQELLRIKTKGQKTLPGTVAFKLYDTYGFPIDLTRLMAEEHSVALDEAGFETELEAAKTKAKASWKGKGIATDEAHLVQWTNSLFREHGATVFEGYTTLNSHSQALALSNGQQVVDQIQCGERGIVVSQSTSFYGEGGGQTGDQGSILWSMGSIKGAAQVYNTTKQNDIYLHHIEVTEGALKVGQVLDLAVTESERRQTASNHSATHLLHSALRSVLGPHVTQAGSLVDATRLRFDFTHPKSLLASELQSIENLVNDEINRSQPVTVSIKSHQDAIKDGAMALFGEKYGDEVRVIKMGSFSQELCGGTHVSNTSQIRIFKIVSESGVSAGVRRIEALSGSMAFNYLNKLSQQALAAKEAIGASESWSQVLEGSTNPVVDWIEDRKNQIKFLEKEIRNLKKDQIDIEALITKAETFNMGDRTSRFVVAPTDIEDRELLSQITDQLKNKLGSGLVICMGSSDSESHPIIVAATKDLVPELNAGQILKSLSQLLGGKGGGRPDFAQGAIANPKGVKAALNSILKR